MPDLPHLSGKEIVKLLCGMGFEVKRTRGSHCVLRKQDKGCVVPLHKEVALGTLRSALKQANVPQEDFIAAYRQK